MKYEKSFQDLQKKTNQNGTVCKQTADLIEELRK